MTYFKHPLLCMNSTAKADQPCKKNSKWQTNRLSMNQIGMVWLSMGNWSRQRGIPAYHPDLQANDNKFEGGNHLRGFTSNYQKAIAGPVSILMHQLNSFSLQPFSNINLKWLSSISIWLSEDHSWSGTQISQKGSQKTKVGQTLNQP